MKDLFAFYTFNQPYEDSLLYAQQLNGREDLLFDLGDCFKMPASLILRVRWIFLSHTHIDHFCGFPHFLRTILKSFGKVIDIYGPKGIINNIGGALSAYTWNLLDHYSLVFNVHEVEEHQISQAVFDSKKCFAKENLGSIPFQANVLFEHDLFRIRAEILDHKTPVLGFRIEGKNQWAVNKEALQRYEEISGKWLGEVKKKLILKEDESVRVYTGREELSLKEIREKYFFQKKYASYAYITDIGLAKDNIPKALRLAKEVKTLFIESNFLHQDLANAQDTCHLTAYQAGQLARAAKAQKVKLFHFSQRYLKDSKIPEAQFYEEMEQGREAGL